MLKKILLTVGSGFAGLNFGAISGFCPAYLLLLFAFLKDSSATFSYPAIEVMYFLTFAVTGIILYLYNYIHKRNHEGRSAYVNAFLSCLAAGALLMLIICFVISGSGETGPVTYWG